MLDFYISYLARGKHNSLHSPEVNTVSLFVSNYLQEWSTLNVKLHENEKGKNFERLNHNPQILLQIQILHKKEVSFIQYVLPLGDPVIGKIRLIMDFSLKTGFLPLYN